ncbi:hypothetical protein DH86_00002581 [Scytalidium sp. 3C]|nr:hypothetical protein DH86_00002581 [Scytalidium sp. 3C]
MRNPRQPSAKTDLQLISAAKRLFDRMYVRSDLAEKMNALTCRIEKETTAVLESLERRNQKSGMVGQSAFTPGIGSCGGATIHAGVAEFAENNAHHEDINHSSSYNSIVQFGWSEFDHVANFDNGDGMVDFQFASSDSMQTRPSGSQFGDVPDLWQAPLNFEWDQWAAYVARFPGESLDLNDSTSRSF